MLDRKGARARLRERTRKTVKALLQTITAHYLLYVFLASLGLLQLAGARSGNRRLMLLPGRRASAFLGLCLLVGGYVFFFTQSTYYNPGLEGAQLFFEFGAMAFAALVVCAVADMLRSRGVSSTLRRLRTDPGGSRREPPQPQPTGRRYRAKDEVG